MGYLWDIYGIFSWDVIYYMLPSGKRLQFAMKI